MSSKDVAVSVRNLSKAYTIAHGAATHTTVREAIVHRLQNPLQRITKENFWALKDVSFDVQKGDVVGIIGRNGAGKSTLLKVLSQITEPTSGEIRLYGRVGSLLEVGTGFHPELTGRENIFLNGAILGMRKSEIARQFDAIVDFAEVEQFLDTPVKRYSSGMYVRLAFAVAAHLNPEILIVDEVLAVGDAAFQKKCLGKMQDVSQQEGKTVLFVSHNINAVEQLCSSALWLEKGQLRQYEQDVRSIIKDYTFGQRHGASSSEWFNSNKQFENRHFKPLKFSITDKNGKSCMMPISNNEEVWVQIEAEIQDLSPLLKVGYDIYSEDSHSLYRTCHTDMTEEEWPKVHSGVCTFRSRIPTRLLNEGTYKIEMTASIHFSEWLCQPGVNSPSIFLTVQGGLSDSPYWMNKRPGLLAPALLWETD